MQFATCQHRLQHVPCVHRSVGLARTHDQMKFINEEDDFAFRLPHFLEHCFQSLFKLASVLGSGNERAHIKSKYMLILQIFRNIACDNSLRQSFYRCRLADTGLTDQDRIILGLSRKNKNSVADLIITADDRIEFLRSGFLHEIRTVFVQSIVCGLGIVGRHPLVAPHCAQRFQECIAVDTEAFKQRLYGPALVSDHRKEKMLNGNIFVSHRLGFIFSLDKCLVQIRADVWLASADLYAAFDRCHNSIREHFRFYIHFLNELQNQAVFLCQKGIDQMLLLYFLIAEVICDLLQILDRVH